MMRVDTLKLHVEVHGSSLGETVFFGAPTKSELSPPTKSGF